MDETISGPGLHLLGYTNRSIARIYLIACVYLILDF